MKKSAKDLGISKKISILRRHFNLSAEALGDKAGVSGTAIANIEKGESLNPGAEMLANISSKLGVNLNWLLLGEGEMLKPAKPPKKIFVTPDLPMPGPDADLQTGFGSSKNFGKRAFVYKARPSTDVAATQEVGDDPTYTVINFEAAANYLSGYQSQEYYERLVKVTIPRALVGASRQGIIFQIEGNSMTPRFQHRDWVVAELLSPDEWGEVRDFNCCVVVSTANGIQFKRVRNRLMTTLKAIQCNSDNLRYDSFDIESKNLLQLFRFVLHLSSDASNPNDDIYKKVDHLVDTTSDLHTRYEQLAQQIAAIQDATQPAHAPENTK